MALYVNSNVSSTNATNTLNKVTRKLDTNYQRLSTGFRINSAKDDAAGLQISDRLTAQINGLYQGNRNANDGIAVAQTAEGALDEVTSMLQRIRTLAEQSANGTNTTSDRSAIQAEVNALSEEITRIACKTTFGGQQILAGTGKGLVGSDGKISLQVGANANDTIAIDFGTNAYTVAGLATGAGVTVSNGKFDVDSASDSQTTISNVDSILKYLDSKRGDFGAVQNRLESTINNQNNIRINEQDARSRIRDSDYAEEAAEYTANQIRQQVASSILTQANTRPQLALSLLG